MIAARAGERLRGLWANKSPAGADRLLGGLLAPAGHTFRLAVAARNRWYDRRPPDLAPIPVVSVGNLTVGGTGKTPVVRWLWDWLARRGSRAGVVTRGYGDDEVALYGRWFGRDAVFAGSDRVAGIGAAWRDGHDLALLDDGFQHRRAPRAVDILLVAAEDPWRVRMLPSGPYREPLTAARRATHILVTRRTSEQSAADRWVTRLSRIAPDVSTSRIEMRMGGWRDLAGFPVAPPVGDVLAVCSIARPEAFAAGLSELLPDSDVRLAAFPDHHRFGRRDIAVLSRRRDARTVVCTAKDAPKLAAFPDFARCCVAVGFGVVGEPRGPLRSMLTSLIRDS
ncbi:MAG: tetraacyldisaccharide 4'-kinase [Gemmatimonadetes bacterium]|nr:tetraacyldisaccharide 4'-kinase [Gemmatimonadota bacterium]